MNETQMKATPPEEIKHYDTKNIIIGVLVFIVLIETIFLLLGVKETVVQEVVQPSGEMVTVATKTFSGIATDSPVYQDYTACVSSCGQCPTVCEQDLLRRTALETSTESYCEQLQQDQQQSCKDELYRRQAEEQKNAAACDKLSNDDLKADCRFSVSMRLALEKDNVAECAGLPQDYKTACEQAYYMEMAIRKSEASMCEKLLDANDKTSCLETVRQQKEAMAAAPTPPVQEATETTEEQP
ncbi:hypothetical protein HY488_02800 [Candidatus Woesearchaeota archaeon]|nr:hypothetical protein [Candidatus Woesearchaeota archaeon]